MTTSDINTNIDRGVRGFLFFYSHKYLQNLPIQIRYHMERGIT